VAITLTEEQRAAVLKRREDPVVDLMKVGTKGRFEYLGYYPHSGSTGPHAFMYHDAFGRMQGFYSHHENMTGYRESIIPYNNEFNTVSLEYYDKEHGWLSKYDYFAYTEPRLQELQREATARIPQPVVQPLINPRRSVNWGNVDTSSNRIDLGLPSRRSGLRIPTS
jgi:hypothetical protein